MAEERRRPGSGIARAVSRTDVVERDTGTATRLEPVQREEHDWDAANWPIASVGNDVRPQSEVVDEFVSEFNATPESEAFPYHQPDDEDIRQRLFHVED